MNGDQASNVIEDTATEQVRGRSTIEFSYQDQDVAVAVAAAVHCVGGTSCTWDQLAAQMKQSASGGGFRQKVMTARSFGLLEYDHGNVTLTDLGLRIADPKQNKAARVASFLCVPLYREVFEKFKGGPLPPAAAIERTMEALGVAPKQKDKARQVFMRSAKSAGFFNIDPTRLVEPPTQTAETFNAQNPTERKPQRNGSGDGGGPFDQFDPLILGLIKRLPEPGKEWPITARVKWLQAACNNFDLIYELASDERANEIEIRVKHTQPGGEP